MPSPDTNVVLSCPHCRQALSVEGTMASRSIRCPNCQKRFLVLPDVPEITPTPLHKGIVGLALCLLGSLSPIVMLVAMAVTLILGPFALVIGPVVALSIAILLCGYVYLRAGPGWFWFYVGVGLTFSIAVQFWSGLARPGAPESGANAFVLTQASAAAKLLHRAVTVLWLLGAGYVWYRKRA